MTCLIFSTRAAANLAMLSERAAGRSAIVLTLRTGCHELRSWN